MSDTLWCVHVYGPDDLLACASRKDAVQNALWLNLSGYQQQNTDDELMPVAWAVPEPWPYVAEMHAAELAKQNREDQRWTGDETKVRLLAGELFDFTEDGKPIDWHATVAEERKAGAVNALRGFVAGFALDNDPTSRVLAGRVANDLMDRAHLIEHGEVDFDGLRIESGGVTR